MDRQHTHLRLLESPLESGAIETDVSDSVRERVAEAMHAVVVHARARALIVPPFGHVTFRREDRVFIQHWPSISQLPVREFNLDDLVPLHLGERAFVDESLRIACGLQDTCVVENDGLEEPVLRPSGGYTALMEEAERAAKGNPAIVTEVSIPTLVARFADTVRTYPQTLSDTRNAIELLVANMR